MFDFGNCCWVFADLCPILGISVQYFSSSVRFYTLLSDFGYLCPITDTNV